MYRKGAKNWMEAELLETLVNETRVRVSLQT